MDLRPPQQAVLARVPLGEQHGMEPPRRSRFAAQV